MTDLAALRVKIASLVEARDDIVAQLGLDRAFSMPACNWSFGITYMEGDYRQIRDCPLDEVPDLLRPLSRNFTGCSVHEGQHLAAALDWWPKLTDGIPDEHLVRPISLPGELGPIIRGVIVNYDTCVYQERINLLGVLPYNPAPVILEIGGGYGALALALTRILPQARYVICDLPESLMFAGMYLALAEQEVDTTPGQRITLLPNYLFHTFTGSVDLVINTLSMAEMSVHQVRTYAAGISKLIGDHGVFFEQNQDNSREVFGPRAELGNYPKHILPEYFSHCKVIPGPATQGEPHLWTNFPL